MNRTLMQRLGMVVVLGAIVVPALGINEEGNERSAQIAEQFRLARPEAMQKFTNFMGQVRATRPEPRTPPGDFYVARVVCLDADMLPPRRLRSVVRAYEGRVLSQAEVNACIAAIAELCRTEGFVTTYADFEAWSPDGQLLIRLKPGRLGKVVVEGNRFFPDELFLKRLQLYPGQPFNFDDAQYGAFKSGAHMDRKVNLDLEFDPTNRATDVKLNVRDMPPIHLTLEWDSYGSYFIDQNRYRVITLNNNLTGHDDAMQVKMQWADRASHELMDITYRLPLSNRLIWEYYVMFHKAEDYLHDLAGVHKRAWKTFTYLYYTVVDQPKNNVVAELGFVYKNIDWQSPAGSVAKYDHFSGLLLGLNWDVTDRWGGRTIVTDDFEWGIPAFLGSAEEDVDHLSVPGADGEYVRNHLIAARRQAVAPGLDHLLKIHWQQADATLTGVNAFSVGGFFGVIDMRGYPRASEYGENGVSLSTGFGMAPFFLPKGMKVPGSKATFHRAAQVFGLLDWAWVQKNSEGLGDRANTTMASGIVGCQMQLPERLFFRAEIGWPISETEPPDGKELHTWVRLGKTF